MAKTKSNVGYIGYCFMVVATVITAFALLPMAWTIPMTIHAKKCLNSGKKMSTGFKVCALLFVGLVGGILLLCDSDC